MLFNNNLIIKKLFSQILFHISIHIKSKSKIPFCLDQPFIVYHAIKNSLSNNTKLIGLVVNNPINFHNQSINHFPVSPGDYDSKITKMTNFMKQNMFNIRNIYNKKIDINKYKRILDNNKNHFNKLYTICKETGEKVEGNYFTEHSII